MQDFNDPIKLLRQLKGAPLAVLMAMIIVRVRVSADWLSTVTGYTDKPITQALKLLAAYGWIAKVQSGWQISEGVQLPLMPMESEKFRSSSSSSTYLTGVPTIEQEQQVRNNSDSFVANYKVMKMNGIREPALSRLAALGHVTAKFVLAHIKQVKAERGHLGTAIHRIENNWEIETGQDDDDGDMVIVGGGRNGNRLTISAEMVREVAEFTGHRLKCSCLDCSVGRTHGVKMLCPDCKRLNCVCEESEDE